MKKNSLTPFMLSFILLSATIFIFGLAEIAEAQPNFGEGTADKFIARTSGWWAILKGYALNIFQVVVGLEVVLFGVRMALHKPDIGEIFGQFAMLMVFCVFIFAVINNYEEWASNIAITGLDKVVKELGGGKSYSPGEPIAMIFSILEGMIPVLGDTSVWDFGFVMIYVFCMVTIIAVFLIICCQYILLLCEFHIVANAGVLLIGLGGSKMFKDYAINVMRYVLSVGMKLFIFQLIINIGFSILSLSDLNNLQGTSIQNIQFMTLLEIIIQAVILLVLAKTLPETFAGLISGAAIGGGNPLASMGKSVAQIGGGMVAGAAAGAASKAKSGASMLNDAHTVAKGQGASGVGGTAAGMARAMWNARSDAKAGLDVKNLKESPESMPNQLRSQANAMRASKAIGSGGGGSASGSSSSSGSGTAPSSGAARGGSSPGSSSS